MRYKIFTMEVEMGHNSIFEWAMLAFPFITALIIILVILLVNANV